MNGVNFKVGNVTKNTETDFNLILEPVDIPFPEVKTKFIEREFGNGAIDLTEADGNIYYKDRTFSLTFIAQNKVLYKQTLNELMAFLHGKAVQMTFWFDEDYYYEGRVSINQYKCDGYIGNITCDIQTRPYKYKKIQKTVQLNIGSNEFAYTTVTNDGAMPCIPQFFFNGNADEFVLIKFGDSQFTLPFAQQTTFPEIVLKYGDNQIGVQTTTGASAPVFAYLNEGTL